MKKKIEKLNIKDLMDIKGGTVPPVYYCKKFMCKRYAVKVEKTK